MSGPSIDGFKMTSASGSLMALLRYESLVELGMSGLESTDATN